MLYYNYINYNIISYHINYYTITWDMILIVCHPIGVRCTWPPTARSAHAILLIYIILYYIMINIMSILAVIIIMIITNSQ